MPADPATPPNDADPMPQPPEWPGDDACCGSGCDPCIFDLYAEAQNRYRRALADWQARHAVPQAGPSAVRAPGSDRGG